MIDTPGLRWDYVATIIMNTCDMEKIFRLAGDWGTDDVKQGLGDCGTGFSALARRRRMLSQARH